MADVEPKAPGRRRTQRSGRPPSHDSDTEHVESATEESGTRDGRDDSDPGAMAQRAAGLVGRLSGRRPESVVSIERKDAEWHVGVEVIEVSRIPDSADILAVYEVRLDADGDLISFRRTRRYARGQLHCERRR